MTTPHLDRTETEFRVRQFNDELKEMAAYLGGHALMGPLFGVPLLLVEGDDDYRIWSQVPRHTNEVRIAVIPCDGQKIDKYQRNLEMLFRSIRDSRSGLAGYALIDGDRSLPQHHPGATQDYIRYIRLNCREVENLYLSDEVLDLMGTNWTSASASIIAASENYGNKREKLAQAGNWNRQQQDVKDLVEQISQIIDSKNVHWTRRVGAAIGKAKPTGQLAEFLGNDVLSALWR